MLSTIFDTPTVYEKENKKKRKSIFILSLLNLRDDVVDIEQNDKGYRMVHSTVWLTDMQKCIIVRETFQGNVKKMV